MALTGFGCSGRLGGVQTPPFALTWNVLLGAEDVHRHLGLHERLVLDTPVV